MSRNGNLVIIGGPAASGEYPASVVARLKALGSWLKVNGEAIYATRVLPPYQEGEVSYTRSKDGMIGYAICKSWPGRQLVLKGIKAGQNAAIALLGVNEPLGWRQDGGGLTIDLPERLQEESARPCQHAWSFRIPLAKRFP